MKIYDARTPEGRTVDTSNMSRCQVCEGRDGRHALVSLPEQKQDSKGRMQTRKVIRECPNGQVDSGVDVT